MIWGSSAIIFGRVMGVETLSSIVAFSVPSSSIIGLVRSSQMFRIDTEKFRALIQEKKLPMTLAYCPTVYMRQRTGTTCRKDGLKEQEEWRH